MSGPNDEGGTNGVEASDRPEQDSRAPRWVRVFVIVLILLGVLVLALQFTGDHGPGRHLGPGPEATGTESHTP